MISYNEGARTAPVSHQNYPAPVTDAKTAPTPHVIAALLNHLSGHKTGVAGIYNR